MKPGNLFGLSDQLEALDKHGDPLEVLDAAVDFEYFRGCLVEGSAMVTAPGAAGRRSTRWRCSRR